LLLNSNLDLISDSHNTVLLRELAIFGNLVFWEQLLEGVLIRDDLNHVIGSEKSSQFVFSVGVKSWVGLELGVSVIGLVIVGNGLAARAESNITNVSVSDSELLEKILFIRNSSIDDNIGSEGHS